MPVSVCKLISQINSKIVSGGQDAINTARLAGSVDALETMYSVVNLAALPAAADNTGRFIYVEDIETYRYSDGTQWTDDYDTTLTATSGSLWTWGENSYGRLGIGGPGAPGGNKCSPVREICSATDWCQVSTGFQQFGHTVGLKKSGEIWSWGRNACGKLGDGTTTDKCSPVREICSATDWCQVSVGGSTTSAIKTSGQIWSWGRGFGGNLGNGTITNTCSPVREFCSAVDWCQVSAGNTHSAAIKSSGQIWAWGYNNNGQLGDGTKTSHCSPVREFCSATNWCQVDSGGYGVSAIKTSGELWVWGYNNNGQLGDGTLTNRCSPVREFCSATDWCQTSAARNSTFAIKTSGELWVWGYNGSTFGCGRLGDGTLTNRCSPVREFCSATDWCQVSAGSAHTSAIKTSGQLWGWGCNRNGQLGNGSANNNRCSPVREVSSSTDWCQVSAGEGWTAAVKTSRGFNEP